MIKRILAGGVVVVFGLAAEPAIAQFTGYRAAGQGIEEPPPETRRERLDDEIERALWRWGPFHLQPWLGVRNVVYSGGTATTGSDVGVTIGGGLLSYLRFGPDVVFKAQATPEYVWWKESEERRGGHTRLAGDVYGLFNRLQLRVGASRLDDLEIASAEANDYVSRRHDTIAADVELRTYRRLHLFAESSSREVRSLEKLPEFAGFSTLDQDELRFAGGLRFRRGDGLTTELGWQVVETDYLHPATNNSYEGAFPFASVIYDRARYLVRGRLGLADLEPAPGSRFAVFDEPLFDAGILWRFTSRTRADLKFSRYLVDSRRLDVSTVVSERLDARVSFDLYRRSSIRFFGQVGTDDYLAQDSGAIVQTDDVRSLGADLSLPLGRLNLIVGYSILDYDSSEPSQKRRIDRVTVSLSFGVFGDVFAMR